MAGVTGPIGSIALPHQRQVSLRLVGRLQIGGPIWRPQIEDQFVLDAVTIFPQRAWCSGLTGRNVEVLCDLHDAWTRPAGPQRRCRQSSGAVRL